MSAEPLRLDALLESVADGSQVDWDAVEAAADETQRRTIRHLRLVASIAEVHRTVSDEPPPAGGSALLQTVTPGRSIGRWGHLMLLEKINEGAFGEVYRARDPWLDRQVALKLLKPGIASPTRLIAEAQALARVRHHNIVTVHGADIHEGRVGLWMELVRGRTLGEIVASDGPFSASEAVVIGQELCKAVAAVHAQGLVHRDIKAQNVMRESGGRLVLMDFGAGHTPLYAAPELLETGEATVASDIYALGVLLYYLVSGKFPVTGASVDALKDAHARGNRRRLAETRTELPERFVAVVERALALDPDQRYPSALDMQEALHPAGTPALRASWLWGAAAALIAALGLGGYIASRRTAPAPAANDAIRMVALLPLRAASAETSYLADGMTEALMQELSAIDTVRVISRTSVDRASETEKLLPAIARRLGADAILEGAVITSADTIRVDLRLIHAGSDTPVWSRSFDKRLENVFALQRDIAHAVAEELSFTLRERAAPRAVRKDAIEAYFRGRQLLRADNETSARLALEQFQLALRLDPAHGQAHAGLAKAYLFLGGGFTSLDRAEGYRRAKEHVTEALALDPGLAEAHAVRAQLLFESEWDWPGSESEFQQALALDPSLVYARQRYALFLSARGRTDDAMAEIEEARRLDPLSPDLDSTSAALLRYARKYQEALDRYQSVLAAEPHHIGALIGLARTLIAMGRYEEALKIYRSLTVRPSQSFVVAEIAQALAGLGRVAEARATLDELRRNERQAGWIVAPDSYAYIYARLQEPDEAFSALDAAFDERSGSVLWLKVDPRADPLRNDPRFARYLRRLQLEIR